MAENEPLSPKTPRTPGTPYPVANTQAVNELLTMMKGTLNTLGATFDSLGEQSAKVASLGPALDSAHQIHQLRRQMRAQEKHQDARITDIRDFVKDDFKVQIADLMKEQIQDQIKNEIAMQTRAEVDSQITEHLPIPLHVQAQESQQQLTEVRVQLKNSEARRNNSHVKSTNLDEPLSAVLKKDGSESVLWPKTLRFLFSYELDQARALVKDFGLVEHELREGNINRFMAFIGIQFHLIPPIYKCVTTISGFPNNFVAD
ncbi:uncharacterized protein EI90DRAFT_3115271 [Cantharellus anzutake]|uniref:uncharacterized protein n=1 Tax=Cantharellus anzutake TaxID=1750568 RepID=UPI0019039140|nr:uncharacterized protein EI90DRAFT_3115271 [Cantharellus anzutake]KAF8342713.1 hypothetical protein EI90DRAFT_3115271 [Cantharellus anzutake]